MASHCKHLCIIQATYNSRNARHTKQGLGNDQQQGKEDRGMGKMTITGNAWVHASFNGSILIKVGLHNMWRRYLYSYV